MSYRVQLQCPPNFKQLIENGIKMEGAMVWKGEIKFYSRDNAIFSNSNNNNNSTSNNEKSKYWNKNKNIMNAKVVDNQNIKSQQFF